jgi:hypothetical protein
MRKQMLMLFGILFMLFVLVKAPASLLLKVCDSAGLRCSAGDVTGSLLNGEIKNLDVSSAMYSQFDRIKWHVSFGRLVTFKPWLYLNARATDLEAKGWLGVGLSKLAVQDLWIEGSAPVNQSTPFVARIESAKVNYRSADILAVQGQLSAEPQRLSLGRESLVIGSLRSQLQAEQGFMKIVTSNDEGDVALQSLCSVNLTRYSCDLSVDVSELSESSKQKLRALATNSVDDSMYQYHVAGNW